MYIEQVVLSVNQPSYCNLLRQVLILRVSTLQQVQIHFFFKKIFLIVVVYDFLYLLRSLPQWSTKDFPQNHFSTESCLGRCHDNFSISENWLEEGFCTCFDNDNDKCTDFESVCGNRISGPPEFFKMIGLDSWMNVSLTIVLIVVGSTIFIVLAVLIRQKLSASNVIRTTKQVRF